MKLGISLRTMGPQATRETILGCALAAEQAGIDDIFIPDHIAIPPDDAEGSDGRYLDPLTTLAFLAARTERVGLGTGVLILPYRPPLATAKAIATVQELSQNRLILGIGVGWMAPEFQVLGIDRRRRGEITDRTLEFLHRCFESDEVEENGQRFLFRPRPPRPLILVGGAPPHAILRTVRFGDGWMPMGGSPEKLRPHIENLRAEAARAGRGVPEVVAMSSLPLDDPDRAAERAVAYSEVGVTRLVHASRYADAEAFRRNVDVIAAKIRVNV